MKRYLLFVLVFLAVACGPKNISESGSSELVRTALSDSSSTCFKAVASYVAENRYGTVAIVGDKDRVYNMRSFFLKSDMIDNGNGSLAPDGLADFSGERIDAYGGDLDAMLENPSYCSMLALCALDSLLWSSRFEASTDLRKIPAKSVVFVSGADCSEFKEIIDTKGLDVLVTDYESAVEKYVARRHSSTCEYALWTPSNASAVPDSLFKDMMEVIREKPYTKPYSAVVIDAKEPQKVIDAVSKVLEDIKKKDTEENVRARRFFAPDFEFIDGRKAVAIDCYDKLRSSNKLTMKIEHPESRTYKTAVNNDRLYVLK